MPGTWIRSFGPVGFTCMTEHAKEGVWATFHGRVLIVNRLHLILFNIILIITHFARLLSARWEFMPVFICLFGVLVGKIIFLGVYINILLELSLLTLSFHYLHRYARDNTHCDRRIASGGYTPGKSALRSSFDQQVCHCVDGRI